MPNKAITLNNVFENCASSSLPVMDVEMVNTLDCTFKNMKNIVAISFLNFGKSHPVNNINQMCYGCSKLLREPSGIKYDDCSYMWATYYTCMSLKPSKNHYSFPKCTNLGWTFNTSGNWDEFDSYTVDAPVATSLSKFLENVHVIKNLTINVGNPDVDLGNVMDIANGSRDICECTINCPTPLKANALKAFAFRNRIKKFPYGVTVNGDTITLDIESVETNQMFSCCYDIMLPVTAATRKIHVTLPNSVNAFGTFLYAHNSWGDHQKDRPIDLTIDAPVATDISSLVRVARYEGGSINTLTINAPKATKVEYCIGSLYAKNGYTLNFPLADKTKPIFNDDIKDKIHVVMT